MPYQLHFEISTIEFIITIPTLKWFYLSDGYNWFYHNFINFTQFTKIYWETIAFYLPLGVIGVYRWSVWLLKKIVGFAYRPKEGNFTTSVSIVTPVYNENPFIFEQALISWTSHLPNEIIAVIDYTDTKCIDVFNKFARDYKGAKLIITDTPGKREALALGIRNATSQVVALVDSDTLWQKDVLKNSLIPFEDPLIAGVATRQNVLSPKTLGQKIFDIQLDLRYFDDFQFLGAASDALICLSGRTAFYRRSAILPLLEDLVNETFLGEKVISGDDKRLTYLVLKDGWKVAYQSNA